MYLVLGTSNNRPVGAARLYRERYPNRLRYPTSGVFQRFNCNYERLGLWFWQ
jgi:hypothetical protein